MGKIKKNTREMIQNRGVFRGDNGIMEKKFLSSHKLITDYSIKGKVKRVVIAWAIYLAIFGITRIPAFQAAIIAFAASVTVDWVTSSVNFIINGFWVIGVGMIGFTPYTLIKKQVFDEMRLYDTGIDFFDSKSETENYAPYADISVSYGKLQASFFVEAKTVSVKLADYAWEEFSEPDVFRSNLERYSGIK